MIASVSEVFHKINWVLRGSQGLQLLVPQMRLEGLRALGVQHGTFYTDMGAILHIVTLPRAQLVGAILHIVPGAAGSLTNRDKVL